MEVPQEGTGEPQGYEGKKAQRRKGLCQGAEVPGEEEGGTCQGWSPQTHT